jgi:Site-specific DNA methylase
MIKSPLNYTGNKFKLLNQIIPVFPKVQKFADVFCGGLNVGINADADVVVCE